MPVTAATAPKAPSSPLGTGSVVHANRGEYTGPFVEMRVRVRRDMRRHITLIVEESGGVYRDRAHLMRELLAEALRARFLRQACGHDWTGSRCRHCGRTRTMALNAGGTELVLQFPTPETAAAFKADAGRRVSLLERADWLQGAFVPIAA